MQTEISFSDKNNICISYTVMFDYSWVSKKMKTGINKEMFYYKSPVRSKWQQAGSVLLEAVRKQQETNIKANSIHCAGYSQATLHSI